MSVPDLKEGFTEWEIIINPNIKFSRAEYWKRGIKRYWGFDPTDKSQKLMYVQYPKSEFSRRDMVRILPKYNNCKSCSLSKKFIKEKNNITSMNFSIVNLFGYIPYIGRLITKNRFMTEPVIMQFISTLTRYPLAIMNTELGKRLFSLVIGVGGLATVRYAIKNTTMQSEWANFFANYISSTVEMNAQKTGVLSLGVADDLAKLKRSIKSGNFYGVADSLIKNPAAIKNAVKGITGQFNKVSGQFSNVFRSGRLRATENTMPNKLFGNKGQQFSVKNSSDFGYIDTAKRFREIGSFGSGFRKERRFRESGDASYLFQ
jgi:hypothetical protein